MASTICLREDGLTWRLIEDEVVLLDLRSSQYFSVNGSGSALWELLARGATRSALAAELRRAYALHPEQAERDVDAFLAALSSHGLVQSVAEPGQ